MMSDDVRKVRYDNPSVRAGSNIGIHEIDIPKMDVLLKMNTDELIKLRKELIWVRNFADGDINSLTDIIEVRIKL